MFIPEKIEKWVKDRPYTCDSIGKSGSQVRCYDTMVLKNQPARESFWEEVNMLSWLENRLPVPKVLEAVQEQGMEYLLMSRIPGKMACDPELLQDPEGLTECLADALKRLWAVDTAGCPRQRHITDYLQEARYRVEQGLVDTDDAEPETFGPEGFKDPWELLRWLEENQPTGESALCHGDFCLPNVFFEKGGLTGYIDLGDCGVGDKWRDIALCWRSLKHNLSGKYASRPMDFDPDILFKKLDIAPNYEKLRYHILLDELF